MTPEMQKIIKQAIEVPGTRWLLHPAVPVGILKRNTRAQRASPIDLLKRKISTEGPRGAFDPNKIGVGRCVPNGVGFDVVIGATRVEMAREKFGATYTVPMEIWPTETPIKAQAELFLDELVRCNPGVTTRHKIGLVTERPEYIEVEEASSTLGGTLALESLHAIWKKHGVTVLMRTAEWSVRAYREQANHTPGVVLRGVAEVLGKNGTIKKTWVGKPAEALLERARAKQAQHGGRGSVASHVANLLIAGKRK